MSAFQATIGDRFAPHATLLDEDADLDIDSSKAVTDKQLNFLTINTGRGSPGYPEILDLCDQRRDLKKKRGEPEGAKDYREIKRNTRTEMKMEKETWIHGQCQEVEVPQKE